MPAALSTARGVNDVPSPSGGHGEKIVVSLRAVNAAWESGIKTPLAVVSVADNHQTAYLRYMQLAETESLIETFHDFLEEIGIVLREGEIPAESFLPGVFIEKGEVVYDRTRLLFPGDILHEAGHIAVTDSSIRNSISGNVAEVNSGKAAEEQAVLLWTWAAICKTGIPAEIVFHEQGYRDESSSLIENFRDGEFEGLDLLVWMKMTRQSDQRGGFPKMTNWLRP